MKLGMQSTSIVVSSGDSDVVELLVTVVILMVVWEVAKFSHQTSQLIALKLVSLISLAFNMCARFTILIYLYRLDYSRRYMPLGANVNIDSEVAVTRFGSGGVFSNSESMFRAGVVSRSLEI